MLRKLGELDLAIEHGRIKLDIVLLALMDRMLDIPDLCSVYREVYKQAKEGGVELEIPADVAA